MRSSRDRTCWCGTWLHRSVYNLHRVVLTEDACRALECCVVRWELEFHDTIQGCLLTDPGDEKQSSLTVHVGWVHHQNMWRVPPSKRSLRKVSRSFLFLLQHWLEYLNDPKIMSRQAKFAQFWCTRQGKSFVLTICSTQQGETDGERERRRRKGKTQTGPVH